VSSITGFSRTVVSQAARANILNKIGVNIFSEGSGLPAKLVEALEVVSIEGMKADDAIEASKTHE